MAEEKYPLSFGTKEGSKSIGGMCRHSKMVLDSFTTFPRFFYGGLTKNTKDQNLQQKSFKHNYYQKMLTPENCEDFQKYGYVVIENVLTQDEVSQARQSLHDTVYAQTGIHHQGENWGDISARLKGPGMKMYYTRWKLDIQLHQNAINSYNQLLQETWASGNKKGYEHPFGPINVQATKQMVDRVCYRLPDFVHSEGGLSLHLDRNPLDPFLLTSGGIDKWRPLQGFICLTDHIDSNSGGLKVVPGFHTLTDSYFSEHASDEVRKQCIGKRGEFFRMGGKSYSKLQKQLEVSR